MTPVNSRSASGCRLVGQTTGALNGRPVPVPARPGFLELKGPWSRATWSELNFDMALRLVPGDRKRLAAFLYRGPLLLAFDPRYNAFDEPSLPAVDTARLQDAVVVEQAALRPCVRPLAAAGPAGGWRQNHAALRLCQRWQHGYALSLVVARLGAPAATPHHSSPGRRRRDWLGTHHLPLDLKARAVSHALPVRMLRDPRQAQPVADFGPLAEPRLILDDEAKRKLPARTPLWWSVAAFGPNGETSSQPPLAWFVYDPSRASQPEAEELLPGPGGVVVRAPLRSDPRPEYGRLVKPPAFVPAVGPAGATNAAIRLNGLGQMLVYALPEDLARITAPASGCVSTPSGRTHRPDAQPVGRRHG